MKLAKRCSLVLAVLVVFAYATCSSCGIETDHATQPQDSVAPTVGDIVVKDVSLAEATVSWKTDEATKCSIKSDLGLLWEEGDYYLDHEIHLQNLNKNTFYWCTIEAHDVSGNTTESDGFELTTKGEYLNLQVGEAADVSGALITITKIDISDGYTVTDQQGYQLRYLRYESAPEGKLFAVVELKVVNNSPDAYEVWPINFHLYDSLGVKYFCKAYQCPDGLPSQTILSPNQQVVGKTLFEVPQGLFAHHLAENPVTADDFSIMLFLGANMKNHPNKGDIRSISWGRPINVEFS